MSPDETPFRESFSPLQDVILFVPSTSCQGSSAFSSARNDMHDRPKTGSTLGPTKHALSKSRIISNSCGPFSRFENKVKWDRNDRAKRITSKKRKFKFRDAHTERYRCKFSISLSAVISKGGGGGMKKVHKIPEFHLEIIILCHIVTFLFLVCIIQHNFFIIIIVISYMLFTSIIQLNIHFRNVTSVREYTCTDIHVVTKFSQNISCIVKIL